MLPDIAKTVNRMAISLLSAALLSCATASEKHETADIYLQLGVRYLSMNRLELAKENLERALSVESDNIRVHNALAYLYEKINKIPEAKENYQTALKLAPDDLDVQNNYGRFLCDHGEYQQGLALLSQASSSPLNDKQWLALTNTGRCQLAMGQKQKAKTYFKLALQLNDSYAPALLEMQKLSYQSGEFWPAKGYLQRYLINAQHTPETLWFALQTERALGNDAQAQEYQNLLLEKFPLSNEAKQIRP